LIENPYENQSLKQRHSSLKSLLKSRSSSKSPRMKNPKNEEEAIITTTIENIVKGKSS